MAIVPRNRNDGLDRRGNLEVSRDGRLGAHPALDQRRKHRPILRKVRDPRDFPLGARLHVFFELVGNPLKRNIVRPKGVHAALGEVHGRHQPRLKERPAANAVGLGRGGAAGDPCENRQCVARVIRNHSPREDVPAASGDAPRGARLLCVDISKAVTLIRNHRPNPAPERLAVGHALAAVGHRLPEAVVRNDVDAAQVGQRFG